MTRPSTRSPGRRPFRRLSAVALASTFALAGCTGDGAGAAETSTLRWAPASVPWSWDPVVLGSTFQFNQLSLVYASLTEIDENGEAQPGLAESWDYNDAGDEVTFHLREGLTFQDGAPVNAEAVRLYIERAQDQEDSALAGDLTSIDEVTADSETDVTFHLNQVDHQIPLLLGRRVAQITSPESDPDDLTSAPVGAGPFRAVEIDPESRAVLEKNPDYWDAEDIHIDRVEISWGIDEASLASALQTGVYNFVELPESQAQAAEGGGVEVVTHPGFNAQNISVNANTEPFDDPAVLEAARLAIDREQFVERVSFGYGAPTSQPFPEGYIAWSEEVEEPWAHDPERARELLADAGYADGVDVDFVVREDSASNELVQSQLAAVGINANLQVSTNWEEPFFGKELALSTYGTTGRESPVQTLTAHFGERGPLNLTGEYENAEFLEAVKLARETPLDSPDYAENLQAATAAGVSASPTIFTYSNPNIFGKNGISELPQIPGQIHWKGVEIEDE